jgi:hypothetical protein
MGVFASPSVTFVSAFGRFSVLFSALRAGLAAMDNRSSPSIDHGVREAG